MGAGGSASGSRLASNIAGGWPRQTDPRLRGAWTRVTWSRLVQVHGLVDFVHVGVLLVAALGAARVRVQGLVDCVRDGVLLYAPWWKVPVNMQPKFQQPLPIDRQWMVPFLFNDRVLDIAGVLQRQVCTALVVQKTVEIPQLQFLAFVVVPILRNDNFR